MTCISDIIVINWQCISAVNVIHVLLQSCSYVRATACVYARVINAHIYLLRHSCAQSIT